jgi:heme/copper-type cytochrome/quinol oxidase subunit 2
LVTNNVLQFYSINLQSQHSPLSSAYVVIVVVVIVIIIIVVIVIVVVIVVVVDGDAEVDGQHGVKEQDEKRKKSKDTAFISVKNL